MQVGRNTRQAAGVGGLRAVLTRCGAVLLLTGGCGTGSDGGIVRPPPVLITTSRTLPTGTVGVAYDVTFTATGGTGTATWSMSTAGAPDGLLLSLAGRLTGTPTRAESRTIGVRATSGEQTATADFTLAIVEPRMVITNTSLPDATLGASYSQFLNVAGGEGVVTWSLASGALPMGITLSASGLIAGTTTALASASFRVRAERGALTAERGLTIAVVPPPLLVATSSLPSDKVGESYALQLESSGGAGGNSWSLAEGSLPSGLSLAAGGLISGTPTAAGSVTVTVAVTSGAQRATRALLLTINPVGFPLAALITMPGNVFVPFLVQIARGGTVTWRFGSEPHNAIFVVVAGAPADINIVSNVDISRTFPTVGSFRYDCTIHPGMSGVIEVKP